MNRVEGFSPISFSEEEASSSDLLFLQLYAVFKERKSEEENLIAFEHAVFPRDWLEGKKVSSDEKAPLPSTLLLKCLIYALISHQERFLQLLLEKGVDPVYLQQDPLLTEKLFVLLVTFIEDKDRQLERYPAARGLLAYLEQRCAESERHRHFLFQAGVDCLFSGALEGGYKEELKTRYAKEYIKYVIALAETHFFDIAVPRRDLLPLFLQQAVCKGAIRLVYRLIEQDSSYLRVLEKADHLLHHAILSHRRDVFLFLLNQRLEPADKRSFLFSIHSDNEEAFDVLCQNRCQQELNEAANYSLSIYSMKYLRKLLLAGAYCHLDERKWTQFIVSLSTMSCSNTREEVQEFANAILNTQEPSLWKDQCREDLLRKLDLIFSRNIPDMTYRVRSCSSKVLWGASYGGEDRQWRYEKRFRKSLAGAVCIMESEMGFRALLTFLRTNRSRMAYFQGMWQEGFGELRTKKESNWYTPLSGSRYSIYFDKVQKKIEEGRISAGFKFPSSSEMARGLFLQVIGVLDGRSIPLTKIEKCKGFNGFEWKHTLYDESVKVMRHVERLYSEVIAERLPDRADPQYSFYAKPLVRKITHIHWWMSHATPFLRGSAAITDMFVRSLFIYHHIKITPWLPGAFPDCEALIEGDPDQFCLAYQSFMEPGYDKAFV